MGKLLVLLGYALPIIIISQRSSHCDNIRVAKPKASRSGFIGRFLVSSAQTGTKTWSSDNFLCRCLPETELQLTVTPPPPPVKIVSIFEDGSISPLKSAPWQDVLLHTVSNLE